MTDQNDTINVLTDIIIEQQETIILLVESIKLGILTEATIKEVLTRGHRIREKVLKMKAKINR